jgi:hypothetical protein
LTAAENGELCTLARVLLGLVLSAVLASEDVTPLQPAPEPSARGVWSAVLISATGAALVGGYTAGAFLTGDRPSGLPLAVTGGVVAGGLLGAGIALGVGALRKDPGALLRYLLVPILSGLVGAALGGLGAGLGAQQPGPGRAVTHVVVVTFLLGETITLLVVR